MLIVQIPEIRQVNPAPALFIFSTSLFAYSETSHLAWKFTTKASLQIFYPIHEHIIPVNRLNIKMGLQALYERFLQSPNPLNLAEDATLQYVTTLTSFQQQSRILSHFNDQNRNVVKKKSEKVISAVEGLTSVAVIVETTLEFISAGGAYLPGLDTFIVDRTATLPVVRAQCLLKDAC